MNRCPTKAGTPRRPDQCSDEKRDSKTPSAMQSMSRRQRRSDTPSLITIALAENRTLPAAASARPRRRRFFEQIALCRFYGCAYGVARRKHWAGTALPGVDVGGAAALAAAAHALGKQFIAIVRRQTLAPLHESIRRHSRIVAGRSGIDCLPFVRYRRLHRSTSAAFPRCRA